MYILKTKKQKSKLFKAGFTYVELIVVLAIFSVLSVVVMFNYGAFQSRVDIKNLASDIALKIVEAQKASLAGKLPPVIPPPNWKPSYGGNFSFGLGSNTQFTYFADLDQDRSYDVPAQPCPSGECLEKISITKGNYIQKLEVVLNGTGTTNVFNNLTVTFSRINSGVKFYANGSEVLNVSYAQIIVKSPKQNIATIRLYASGRIQIN